MAILIKIIKDGTRIEYDSGAFDDWCVYVTIPETKRYAPRDVEYFTRLHALGNKYGTQKIYDDFIHIYNLTTKDIEESVLQKITELSREYGEASTEIDMLYTIIYAGMVAEENKKYAILKKRIKRLGMHQVLIEKLDSSYAANFSKGKKWRELDIIMKEKGF